MCFFLQNSCFARRMLFLRPKFVFSAVLVDLYFTCVSQSVTQQSLDTREALMLAKLRYLQSFDTSEASRLASFFFKLCPFFLTAGHCSFLSTSCLSIMTNISLVLFRQIGSRLFGKKRCGEENILGAWVIRTQYRLYCCMTVVHQTQK